MRRALWLALVFYCSLALSQEPDFPGPRSDGLKDPTDRKLPNGKRQSDEILKSEHAKSLQDLRQITELSQSLAAEMERNTSHVLSVASLKKTEELEKLARRVRDRMRRF